MEEREEWYGASRETDRKVLHDEGKGRPIILRKFDLVIPAGSDPTEKDLADAHKSRVQAFLWRDELVLVKALDVRKGAVREDGTREATIFATCQAKAGSAILQAPEILNKGLN